MGARHPDPSWPAPWLGAQAPVGLARGALPLAGGAGHDGGGGGSSPRHGGGGSGGIAFWLF